MDTWQMKASLIAAVLVGVACHCGAQYTVCCSGTDFTECSGCYDVIFGLQAGDDIAHYIHIGTNVTHYCGNGVPTQPCDDETYRTCWETAGSLVYYKDPSCMVVGATSPNGNQIEVKQCVADWCD